MIFMRFHHYSACTGNNWSKLISASDITEVILLVTSALRVKRLMKLSNQMMRQTETGRAYQQPSGAPNDNFRENICSEDDLRSRIFGKFVVKFLACLPLLGFSNI